jgi:tRNA threonylcarbamoyl adenosine modification protein YeaZ
LSTHDGLILAIESALAGGSISLYSNAQEIASWTGSGSVSSAEKLLPRIDELLRGNSVEIGDIDLLAVSTGPGSYTGIRVGIATVLGLRATTGVECVGMTSISAMAFSLSDDQSVIVAVPMGRNMVCAQIFGIAETDVFAKVLEMSEFVHRSSGFAGTIILHGELFSSISTMLSGKRTVDAGSNIASFIARAARSGYATAQLDPFFAEQ